GRGNFAVPGRQEALAEVPAAWRTAQSRARRCKDNGDKGRLIPCRNRSDAAFAKVPPKTPASARHIQAAQRRQEFGSAPNRSLWKNGPIPARTRSYFKPQERRVLLRTIDVTVARVTPPHFAPH